MTSIRTIGRFESGHRQFEDPEKCGNLHGHNWKVEFIIAGDTLDELGYLINFSVLKDMLKVYDHKVLLHELDPLAAVLEEHKQKVVRLPANPTCENLARIIKDQILQYAHQQGRQFQVVIITVYENPESFSTDQYCNNEAIMFAQTE